ncbi:cyclic nucleotide-binding domain-containing protein [Elstera litoralis]|uniref:cyclic nucleotide-binding domain-containing protein n=1 Tax=Elstera litoralis TaxID=552518 RepID=UPI000696B99A|nr:cyclic nucleotide-binding domain-containing protein [Elstera litoralis]
MRKPAPLADRRLYNPGAVIVSEGDEGYSLYLIETGSVEVFKTLPTGETILGRIGKGGIFGEMALVDDSKRMASVRAAELTTCQIFPREYFQYRLGRSDKLIQALMRIFTGHIRSLTQLQADVGAGEVQRPNYIFTQNDVLDD